MTATTGSSGARGKIEKDGRSVDPRRPDHLVVWLSGRPGSTQDQVIHDARLGGDFSLPVWADEVRHGHPISIAGATFPPHLMGRDPAVGELAEDQWLELTRVAAGVDHRGDHRSFTGDTTPTSLSALRRWAEDRLDGLPFAVHDIILTLSELSTNVERHGGDWLTVDLVDQHDMVVVAVTDPATDRWPAPRDASPEEPSGRGLLVVASLALRWGVVSRPAHKTVWAAFPSLR